MEVHLLQSLPLLHHVQLGSFFAPSASLIADVRRWRPPGGAKDDAIILIENRLQRREKKRLQVRSLSLPHSLSRGLLGVQRTKERQNTMTWCSLEEEASERRKKRRTHGARAEELPPPPALATNIVRSANVDRAHFKC